MLLIVDIGANDGLMSSNSFNFIQLGWNATLVEPQVAELNLAKTNIERYVDPYNENKQIVRFVNCVIGDHDGLEDFVLQGSSLGMESHVYDPRRAAYEAKRGTDTGSQLIVKVQSMTVPTFANKYKIPVNFGILSIDAEGFGDRGREGYEMNKIFFVFSPFSSSSVSTIVLACGQPTYFAECNGHRKTKWKLAGRSSGKISLTETESVRQQIMSLSGDSSSMTRLKFSKACQQDRRYADKPEHNRKQTSGVTVQHLGISRKHTLSPLVYQRCPANGVNEALSERPHSVPFTREFTRYVQDYLSPIPSRGAVTVILEGLEQ
ncbi:hypothetical protein C0Q70_06876 [Pomacea canaliculata]|uniref:Methyltransferase FkbM domain-containing protein n=1 Tax=Pomacea canaliculata TaxID=400727 RepID=A0A2T7PDG9_POMCA|nr:hypothetical protein C0Q70_06876 [Pomacea canaliculata]